MAKHANTHVHGRDRVDLIGLWHSLLHSVAVAVAVAEPEVERLTQLELPAKLVGVRLVDVFQLEAVTEVVRHLLVAIDVSREVGVRVRRFRLLSPGAFVLRGKRERPVDDAGASFVTIEHHLLRTTRLVVGVKGLSVSEGRSAQICRWLPFEIWK